MTTHFGIRTSDLRSVLPFAFFIGATALLLNASTADAQLITMSSECRESVASGDSMNASGDYQGALNLFTGIVEECDTKDGREAVQAGLAKAHNGLGQYNEAIAAADQALDVSKQKSLAALHEKAFALEATGDLQGAKAQYLSIIELTENNVDVAARANNYAKVADLEYRSGNRQSADQYLDQAIQLDPDNPAYNVQRSDWATDEGDQTYLSRLCDLGLAGRVYLGGYRRIHGESRPAGPAS